jgi:hypothetical protein
MSALAEISGQSSERRWSAKTLIWRGVQMCSIIFQPGFLPFDESSPARNGGLALAAADWKSFEQSVGPPGASQSAKATPLAEIATRVTESFGTVNGSVHQAGGNIARDERCILHTIKTGTHWPLMA